MPGRTVVAYHPTFTVRTPSGEGVIIEVDMNDWYSDDEVRESLYHASGYRTWRDLVVGLGAGELTLRTYGCLAARIKNTVPTVGSDSMDWDDLVTGN
jgi:hypothetical protein